MIKNILITGGTGLVGKHLTRLLISRGYNVSILSRSPKKENGRVRYYQWNVSKGYMDETALIGIDAIIHLAGANIGSKRWSERRKQEILNSRIDSTALLFRTIEQQKIELKKFISASAIGYYGTTTCDTVFTEESEPGTDLLADVCRKWESEVLEFQKAGIDTAIIRTGIVLANEGGALPKMKLPAKLGLNAPIGSGRQYMPWIHIQDLCNIYLFLLENRNMSGIFNAVSSQHTDNSTFSRVLSNVMQRPFFMPNVPAFIIRILFGEMAMILLQGSRVSNKKIKALGFNFSYDKLELALSDLLP